MGVPIEPPPWDPNCCDPSHEGAAVGPRPHDWPLTECADEDAQWAWLMQQLDRYKVVPSTHGEGCLNYCVYEITAILQCETDGFNVGMRIWYEYLGMTDNPTETFGARKVMIEQGFGPLPDLLNEQVRLNDEEWFGVRDGTRNVKVLFKRDLTSKPP